MNKKMNRSIDPIKMEQAKQRTMNRVMARIDEEQPKTSWLRVFARPLLIPSFILLFALVVIFSIGNSPQNNPPVLSAFESQKLAELSYLTSSFVGVETTISNESFMFLNTTTQTQFEDEDERINFYFDTLRIYLEEDSFNDAVTVQELTDSEFDYLITFTVRGETYEFYITLEDTVIDGELVVNSIVYAVNGSFEKDENEIKMELEAINGDNYVHIDYKTETEDEIETKYEIESRINGIESSQEIKVSLEGAEAKVEIKDGENEFTLKREMEDNVMHYKLEYEINGVEGEARIQENVDENGNVTYHYNIKEGDVEKEIDRGRPDYIDDRGRDDDDDDDEPGNNGNRNDDKEDEEDNNPGNGNKSDDDEEDELDDQNSPYRHQQNEQIL